MRKTTCLLTLLVALGLNVHVAYAAAENPEKFTQPELQLTIQSQQPLQRPVVKVSALPNDGLHISIPLAALTTRNNIPGVFVLENNQARFRMVRLGKTGKSQVDILSGLFGDETLLLGELNNVHDGSPVSILSKKAAVKK